MNTVIIPLRQSEITKELTITDTYAMKVGDRVIIANLAATKNVTLPIVKEAAGHVFSIFGLDVTGHSLLIYRNDGDLLRYSILFTKGNMVGVSYLLLDTNGEYVILYSDGYHWHPIAGNFS